MSTAKLNISSEKMDRLKLLIISTKKSQTDFAKALGYDKTLISKICNGKAPITLRLEELIISTFNINREWWESGNGEIFSPVAPRLDEKPGRIKEQHLDNDYASDQEYIIKIPKDANPALVELIKEAAKRIPGEEHFTEKAIALTELIGKLQPLEQKGEG